MTMMSPRIVNASALLLVIFLLGCSQSNGGSDRVSSETTVSSKQSAADVKQEDNNVGQSIVNTDARLTNSILPNPSLARSALPSLRNVQTLYAEHASHVQVEDAGKVVKVLADDNQGARHQRFLVKVATGQTLLFAHNIDLAARVENVKIGDNVEFRGEYIWNEKGGIVHWTHHDPQGYHHDGWIKHNGSTYQ